MAMATRKHRSSTSGQYMHGDTMRTLKINLRNLRENINAINKLQKEMNEKQEILYRNLYWLRHYIGEE